MCGKNRRELFEDLVEQEGRENRWVSPNLYNALNPFEVHHVVPIHLGGNSSLENLIVLCKNCHLEAHKEIRISETLRMNHQQTFEKFGGSV
jgi:hypothetical protein